LRKTRGQRFAALMQQTDEIVDESGEPSRHAIVETWRAVVAFEHDAVIGQALDDARDAQHRIRIGHIGFEREAHAQLADLHQRRRGIRIVAVAHFQFGYAMPREIFFVLVVARFRDARSAHGQRQRDQRIARAFRNIERLGQIVVGGQIERRAVGHHARARQQRDLAELEQLLVDLERGQPPAIRTQSRSPRFQLRLQIAVVLLQMLRLQEHPLRPDDFAVPGHVCRR
jgi:hypothetical protein